ncbi:MAG: nitrous oxide reductase accessory protein NosL [Desulfosarcinaceae bacterium]|nr:nitrous oxide reductase accessory protein NosL [Desulfosarcinaceae bacterium]
MRLRRYRERHLALSLTLGLLISLAVPTALSAGETAVPPPARQGLSPQGQLRLHGDDTCPVCAMRPAKWAKFAAAIELTDERTYYFCSNGCMLRAWRHPERFLNAAPKDRLRPIAQTFFSGRSMDGREVIWVAGSEVMGPMGPAIVALESPGMANAFQERHGGRLQFKLDEMTDALWQTIKGRPAHP